ncbi:MAG: TIGR01777 family oxidoreductase [Myxococcaceae bacterium]
MKIAIAGGTGFIGRALVQTLANAGHEVVVLPRQRDALRALSPDAVVNLAGENLAQRWTPEAKQRIVESRVEGTQRLVSLALEAGTVRTFVSASAIGYYGNRGAEPLTEASAPGDDFLARLCRQWEEATRPAGDGGMRTVILRIGVVLHPEGGALRKMLPLFRAGLGGPFGSGEQYMSWIHRGDVVRLIQFALERGDVSGPFNATAPAPVTNRAFTRALAGALRRPALLPVPSFALRAALGEMANTVLGGARVLPERALNAGFTFEYPALEQALGNLLASPGPR